jgi:hypothetical protein
MLSIPSDSASRLGTSPTGEANEHAAAREELRIDSNPSSSTHALGSSKACTTKHGRGFPDLLGGSRHLGEDEHKRPHQGEEAYCAPAGKVKLGWTDGRAGSKGSAPPVTGKTGASPTAGRVRATVCRPSPPPILTKCGFHKHPADALVNSEGPCGSASERFPVLLHSQKALVISLRLVPARPRSCGPSQPAASPLSPRRAQTGCSHSCPSSARHAPRPCSAIACAPAELARNAQSSCDVAKKGPPGSPAEFRPISRFHR